MRRFPAMKTLLLGFAALFLPSFGSAASANPVNKVVQLLTDLEAKINAEGVEAHRAHEEFAAWCKQSLLGASSESLQTKIDDLAGSAATMDADLKAAAAIRAKEHADFEKLQKELLDCWT